MRASSPNWSVVENMVGAENLLWAPGGRLSLLLDRGFSTANLFVYSTLSFKIHQ
jgi:hypothetical protein